MNARVYLTEQQESGHTSIERTMTHVCVDQKVHLYCVRDVSQGVETATWNVSGPCDTRSCENAWAELPRGAEFIATEFINSQGRDCHKVTSARQLPAKS